MTLGEKAIQWYEANEPEGSFPAALLRCFLFGVVVRRPELVILAEEVLTNGAQILAIGPGRPRNCWWLHYVGAPQGATTPYDWMAEAPYPLDYIAFRRRGKTRIYSWEKIKKDVYGRSPKCTTASTT